MKKTLKILNNVDITNIEYLSKYFHINIIKNIIIEENILRSYNIDILILKSIPNRIIGVKKVFNCDITAPKKGIVFFCDFFLH